MYVFDHTLDSHMDIVSKKGDKINIYYPSSKKYYLNFLNSYLHDLYQANLVFLKIVFETKKTNIKNSRVCQHSIEDCMYKLESTVADLDFLHFVYSRAIVKKNKIKIISLIAVKSILGYDPSYSINNTYENIKIKHLANFKEIKKLISYILKERDIKKLYTYEYLYPYVSGTWMFTDALNEFIHFYLRSRFKPRRFSMLDYLTEKKEINFFSLEDCRFSVREQSYLSIINLWSFFMSMNNLVYDMENKKIYKKISDKEYEYFSELNYLYDNIISIFKNIDLKNYNISVINNLINNFLEIAIKKLPYLVNYYFPIKKGLTDNLDLFFDNFSNLDKALTDKNIEYKYLSNLEKKEILADYYQNIWSGKYLEFKREKDKIYFSNLKKYKENYFLKEDKKKEFISTDKEFEDYFSVIVDLDARYHHLGLEIEDG